MVTSHRYRNLIYKQNGSIIPLKDVAKIPGVAEIIEAAPLRTISSFLQLFRKRIDSLPIKGMPCCQKIKQSDQKHTIQFYILEYVVRELQHSEMSTTLNLPNSNCSRLFTHFYLQNIKISGIFSFIHFIQEVYVPLALSSLKNSQQGCPHRYLMLKIFQSFDFLSCK